MRKRTWLNSPSTFAQRPTTMFIVRNALLRRFLLALFFLSVYLGYSGFFGFFSYASSVQSVPSPVAQASLTPQPSAPVPQPPLKLSIPKINVMTNVERVAHDAQGRMDVPKNADNVGWYELGIKPGEQGSAVFAGHLDTPTGKAVFFDLEKLEVGDEIVITDADQKNNIFIIEEKVSYPENEFPIAKVFTQSDKKRLNLITCEGVFNRQAKMYSHRLVVYAVLKE